MAEEEKKKSIFDKAIDALTNRDEKAAEAAAQKAFEEKKAAGVAPFEEVQESLQQKVLMEAQKAAYDKKVEELRKQFDVKIN